MTLTPLISVCLDLRPRGFRPWWRRETKPIKKKGELRSCGYSQFSRDLKAADTKER